MTSLLRLLREYPKAVEAYLSQYHHIDIRDRSVRDENGRRKLTLSMIAARILEGRPEGNPIDTALNGGVRPPSRVELLLSDLWKLQTGGQDSPRLQFAERAAVKREDPGRQDLIAQRSREAKRSKHRKKSQ